jgi:chromosome segregation ATPase
LLEPRPTLQAVRDKEDAQTEAVELAEQLAASKVEKLRLEAKVLELEGQMTATNSTLEGLHRDLVASRSARVAVEGGLEEANEKLAGLRGDAERLEAQKQAVVGEAADSKAKLQTAESQVYPHLLISHRSGV